MPYHETVEELAEALADMPGIYNQGLQFVGMTVQETRAYNASRPHGDCDGDHADTCRCRMCWCAAMERRIRAAVTHEESSRPRRSLEAGMAELRQLVGRYFDGVDPLADREGCEACPAQERQREE